MTDLDALSEAAAPRPDRIAQRFARRIDPTWGFVLYGFLYWAFIANMVGTLPLIFASGLYKDSKAFDWMMWGWLAWYPLSQVPCWWVFRRWMRRRRGDSIALVRDGEIVTASVTHQTGTGGRRSSTIVLRGVTLQSPVQLDDKQHCKVLFLAGARHCFVFDLEGNAVACGIGRGNPIGPVGRQSNAEPLPAARVVE